MIDIKVVRNVIITLLYAWYFSELGAPPSYKSGAILWLIAVLVIAFLSLYLVAYFGQQKGHDETVTLRG